MKKKARSTNRDDLTAINLEVDEGRISGTLMYGRDQLKTFCVKIDEGRFKVGVGSSGSAAHFDLNK